MEDALRLNQEALERHGIRIERDIAQVPAVRTDKHKVLTILVNLLSNAKYAWRCSPWIERRLRVSLERLARASAAHPGA